MRTGWFYIIGVTLLFWVTQPALAERHAIVVGVNQGPSPLVPLRYAHDDARKIEEILRELGGVPKSNMRLLLEPDLEELQSILWTTTSAAKPGDEPFFTIQDTPTTRASCCTMSASPKQSFERFWMIIDFKSASPSLTPANQALYPGKRR